MYTQWRLLVVDSSSADVHVENAVVVMFDSCSNPTQARCGHGIQLYIYTTDKQTDRQHTSTAIFMMFTSGPIAVCLSSESLQVSQMAVCFCIGFVQYTWYLPVGQCPSVFASSIASWQVAAVAVCFCIVFVQHTWSLPVALMGLCFCIVFPTVHLCNRNIASVFASSLLMCICATWIYTATPKIFTRAHNGRVFLHCLRVTNHYLNHYH